MAIMNSLQEHCIMKGVGKPQCYLGGDVVDLPSEWSVEGCATAFSAKTHIEQCTKKLAQMCGKPSFKKANVPFPEACHPELDVTPFCDLRKNIQIQVIGWMCQLGDHFRQI